MWLDRPFKVAAGRRTRCSRYRCWHRQYCVALYLSSSIFWKDTSTRKKKNVRGQWTLEQQYQNMDHIKSDYVRSRTRKLCDLEYVRSRTHSLCDLELSDLEYVRCNKNKKESWSHKFMCSMFWYGCVTWEEIHNRWAPSQCRIYCHALILSLRRASLWKNCAASDSSRIAVPFFFLHTPTAPSVHTPMLMCWKVLSQQLLWVLASIWHPCCTVNKTRHTYFFMLTS